MRIFVTGANGFIGSHVVSVLLKRGHMLTCLLRDPSHARAGLKGATLARGDVTERESMRESMRGADAVVHLAGLYKIGNVDKVRMRAINVDGARNTLELAAELSVQKIIHISTVGVFGNTRGRVVDETYRAVQNELTSEYEKTKWAAHYEIAEPLQKRGAPVIIVQPGGVIGAGDTSPLTSFYDFYFRRTPMMLGAKSGITWAHVDDVAEGIALALERGRVGEAYVIAGPPLTYRDAMQLWEKITGIPAPRIWLPGWFASAMARVMGAVESIVHRGFVLSSEGLRALADYTFYASADKAKRELGWKPRSIDDTFKDVLEYEMRRRK